MDSGFSQGGGRDFFQKLGTNLKKKDQNSRKKDQNSRKKKQDSRKRYKASKAQRGGAVAPL